MALGFAACGGSSGQATHAGSSGESGAAGEEGNAGGSDASNAGAAGAEQVGGVAAVVGGGGAGGVDDSPTVTDAGAGAGVGGAAGAGGAGAEALPGDALFTADSMLEVRLTLDDKVWQSLEEHGNNETYVAAAGALRLNDGATESFAKLGVRHKGAWSLHHCWDNFGGVRSHQLECQKLSYKLEFDQYQRGGSYDGLKHLNLHAASGDDTKLRELVAYQTFRDAGVDAPRAAPARLYINGAFQGIFIAVEEIDDRYTEAHFPDASAGNLYKEVWPNPAVSDDELSAALETNQDAANVSDLRSFARAVGRTTLESFDEDLARYVDVQQLLAYIAVDRELRNWDGITAFYSPLTPHNFYWYHDSGAQKRFHLIPWDLDNTLWAFDPYMYPEQWVTAAPVPDLNSTPANCEPRSVWDSTMATTIVPPRCDKLLDLLIRNHWDELATIGTTLRAGALAPASMQVLADHYRVKIAPIVAEDPTLDAVTWGLAVDGFSAILEDAAADFDRFMAGGLIEEPAPPAEPEPPTQEELDAPTLDEGLHVGGITNFEFAAPPVDAAPVGVVAFGDPLAVFSPAWSSLAPLSGKADVRLDFTFNRGPEAYDEWVNLGIFSAETDVTAYRGVVVWLASDKERQIRVRVMSPAYDESFGGVYSEFGVDRIIGPTPSPVVVDFASLYYPEWARAAWTGAQGFPGTDEEARALVLSRFDGLMFVPQATVDLNGELVTDTETGYLRVDNIYFR